MLTGTATQSHLTSGVWWIRRGPIFLVTLGAIYGALKGMDLWPLGRLTDDKLAAFRVTDRATGWALVFASLTMLLVFAILERTAISSSGERSSLGWAGILLGADGRVSTSKGQIILWTLGVSYALAYLGGIAAFVKPVGLFGGPDDVWSDYLILLGGPFAAAVIAKFTVVSKIQNGTIQKPLVTGLADPRALGQQEGPTTVGRAQGFVTDDSGNIDVVDTQYVIFNLIAFLYVTAVFLSVEFTANAPGKYQLPQIPSILLGLTGVAAATYVGNKSIQRSGPRISSVGPVADGSGEWIIRGVNLVPAGMVDAVATLQTSVVLAPTGGASSVQAPLAAAPTSVRFKPPSGTGTVEVAVVTAIGLATNSWPIEMT